jgi:hypothetical protein
MRKLVFLFTFALVFAGCSTTTVYQEAKPIELVEEILAIDTDKWNSPKTYIGALYDHIVVVITYNAETNEGIYYNFNSENAPYVEPFTVKGEIATSLNKRYGYYVTYYFNEGYHQIRFGNLICFELGTEQTNKIITDSLNINNPIMDDAMERVKRLLE